MSKTLWNRQHRSKVQRWKAEIKHLQDRLEVAQLALDESKKQATAWGIRLARYQLESSEKGRHGRYAQAKSAVVRTHAEADFWAIEAATIQHDIGEYTQQIRDIEAPLITGC